jgi:hypothetical protein
MSQPPQPGDPAQPHSTPPRPSRTNLVLGIAAGLFALGIAATQNPDLAAEAMDDILDGRVSAIDVWIEVARCSSGPERAAAAALAAMAAWQEHEPSAVAFAEIALDADTESALAWAVWHLVGTGAAPEHVRPAVDHKEVAA